MELLIAVGVAINIIFVVLFWRMSHKFPSLLGLAVLAMLQSLDFALFLIPREWVPTGLWLFEVLLYGHYYLAGPLIAASIYPLISERKLSKAHFLAGVAMWALCSLLAAVMTYQQPSLAEGRILDFLSIPLPLALMTFYLSRMFKQLSAEKVLHGTLRKCLALFILINLFTIVLHLSMIAGLSGDIWKIILPAVYSIIEFALFIAVLLFLPLVPDQQKVQQSGESQRQERLSNSVRQGYVSKLKSLLENEPLYLRPGLKIIEVAELLDVPQHGLSEAINLELETSFQNLINGYRIEHVTRAMMKSSQDNLLDLAISSGFGSKAAFNRAFKQVHGVSPSNWRSQQNKG